MGSWRVLGFRVWLSDVMANDSSKSTSGNHPAPTSPASALLSGASPAGLRARPWNRWRERYNPLHGLNVARAVSLLEQYQRGEMADPQWAYFFIEQSDADLFAILERRQSALLQLDWEIKQRPFSPSFSPASSASAPPSPSSSPSAFRLFTLGSEQAACLREAYERLDNLYEAIAHLQLATFRGFAHCEKHRSANGDIQHLELVDQWNLVRDLLRGRWKYNPEALSTTFDSLSDELLLDPADFLIRECDRHVNRLALLKFVRTNLSEKDWDAFIEIYGLPSGVVIGPLGVPPEKEHEFKAAAQAIAEGGSGYLPAGSDYRPNEHPQGNDPFRPRLDYLSEKLVLAGTGGLLTMLTQSGSGTLAGSVHQEAFATIARAEARRISELFQHQFDAEVLHRHFPGQPVLAYFELAAHEPLDPGAVADHAQKFAAAGYRLDPQQLSELSGYRLTEANPQHSISNRVQNVEGYLLNKDIPPEEIERWVTIHGHHIPIRKKQPEANQAAVKGPASGSPTHSPSSPAGALDGRPTIRATPTFGGELAQGHLGTAIGIGHEAVRRLFSGLIGPTESERIEQSIPWGTNPDGSPRYEYKPLGDRMAREQGLFTPFLPQSRLEPQAGDSTATASGKAVFNSISSLVGSIESPLGITLFGADGLAAKIGSGAFAIDQLAGIQDRVGAAMKADTTQGKIEGVLGALTGLGFGAFALKGALGQAKPAGAKLPPEDRMADFRLAPEEKPAEPDPAPPAPPLRHNPAAALLSIEAQGDIERAAERVRQLMDVAHETVGVRPGKIVEQTPDQIRPGYHSLSREIRLPGNTAIPHYNAAHEIAHWLDHGEAHNPNYRASESSPELEEWRNEALNSAAIKVLQRDQIENRADSDYSYALRFREIWARSYAQWLARRTNDPTLTRELDRMRKSPNEFTRNLHWTDEDFQPIARSIDNLFKSNAWLP